MSAVINPFKRVNVEAQLCVLREKAVLVSWSLRREFNEPGPYTFKLYRGRAATDTFELISETTDQPWLFDKRPKFASYDVSTFYQVELIDGNGVSYKSDPANYEASWNHHDWVTAREIVRQETILYRRKGGTKGWLLKRRQWGDTCTTCTDPNTQQCMDAHCPVCYGTTIVGGYYPALEYWVLMNPTSRSTKLVAGQGVITANSETVRGFAYPAPMEDDIWVQHYTGERFRIQPDVKTLVRVRGIGVVVDFIIKQLPQTDIAHEVPLG